MPLPFEPNWIAFRGGVKTEGKGLLQGPPDTVEKFVVKCGGFDITVEPKKGLVWLDTSPAASGTPGKLVWKRRMQFQMQSNGDNNTNGMAQCLHYIIGIDGDTFRLFENGRVCR